MVAAIIQNDNSVALARTCAPRVNHWVFIGIINYQGSSHFDYIYILCHFAHITKSFNISFSVHDQIFSYRCTYNVAESRRIVCEANCEVFELLILSPHTTSCETHYPTSNLQSSCAVNQSWSCPLNSQVLWKCKYRNYSNSMYDPIQCNKFNFSNLSWI